MQEKLVNILIVIISVLLALLIASWVYFSIGGMQTVNAEYLRAEQELFLVFLFGLLTALFAVIFFVAVGRGDAPVVETHWGGIGGSLGGWRLSKSLVYFLGALAFGAMAVASLDHSDQDQNGDSDAQTEQSAQPSGYEQGESAGQTEASAQAPTAE